MLLELLQEINTCTLCAQHLPFGCRPVLRASEESKVLVVGQAPGIRVHKSGIPWNDASGKNLRNWLGVDSETFYTEKIFGIVPMGFCYPGTGKNGDYPPRKECGPLWHPQLAEQMPDIKLTLLIGQYAQQYYLGKNRKKNLTETVRNYSEYLPEFFPLPHPSPRNNIWQKRNPWFAKNVLPELNEHISKIIS